MKWNGIIFDRDGTLFDSLPLILRAFNYAIEPFTDRRPADVEWFAAFGPAEREVIAKFIGEQKKEEAFQRFYSYYTKHFSEVTVFPGMRELLKRLKEVGVRLILFTGGGRASTRFCLEKEGILPYFDDLITGDDVVRHKPDPEGILKAMKGHHLEPSKTLVVGDAPADILAGKKAGAITALVKWSSFSQAGDFGIEPDYTFTSIPHLEHFLFGGTSCFEDS